MSKMTVSTVSKVLLAIASVACVIGGFLPWIDSSHGTIYKVVDEIGVFPVIGIVIVLLAIVSIFVRKTALNVITGLAGLIGSLIIVVFPIIIFAGYSSKVDKLVYFGTGIWMVLITAILMFAISIIVLATSKVKKEHNQSSE